MEKKKTAEPGRSMECEEVYREAHRQVMQVAPSEPSDFFSVKYP